MDLDLRLAVRGGGKDLALFGGDGGVALDERRGHAPQRLDAESQGSDVQQEHILYLTAQHTCLDSGSQGHHFVGIDSLVRFAAEELAHGLLDGRHASHAPDQDDLINVILDRLGIL